MEQIKNSPLLKQVKPGTDRVIGFVEPARSNPCPYCGKTFKPRGLGTHIREAHGVTIKTVVRTVVPNSSIKVPDKSTVVPDSSTKVPDKSTVVQRPSDYVRKKSTVVETKIEPVVKWNIDHPGVSVINDIEVRVYSEMAKIKDFSIESYRKIKKRLEDN